MKQITSDARVLVASDDASDAAQIRRQLEPHFPQVRASSDPDKALADFEACLPDVLVLAFDSLEKSQRYYLGLYRLGQALQQHAHRTVILCSRDEVQQVSELCKQEYFDDYVLYWPQTFDGPRLAMSVWVASREMRTTRRETPRPGELLAHARHLGELEQKLDRGLADRAEVDSVWARNLKESLEPSLAGTRVLAERLRNLRPLVMVVDDDEVQRQVIARMLEVSDYDLEFARDGRSALAQLRRARPDVILMDLRMPGMDGVAVTAQIKATPSLASIPVIVMTGDARRETLASSVTAGAVAFIVKPFNRELLQARIEKALYG